MKKLIATVIIVLLAACSPSSTDSYKTTSTSRWTVKTIEVHFMSQKDIDAQCNKIGGHQPTGYKFGACARTKPNDASICEIYAAEPINFDDHSRLETLGHETWHCFGALHE